MTGDRVDQRNRQVTMQKNKISGVLLILLISALSPWLAAYDKKPLPQPAPDACPGWQESQGVFVGAVPYVGERTRELFDLKELPRLGIVAVLVAVRNTNSFPVTVYESGMKVFDATNKENAPVPWESVAGAILQPGENKQVSTGLPPVDIIRTISAKGRPAAIIEDMRTKSFGAKTVAAGETVRGVVYFRLGTDPGNIEGGRFYAGEVANAESGEEMVFFEFDLKLPPPPADKKK
jgi:hypothetical protein